MSKAVAIIPARGGSKRIPRKNIKLFHGKPLIAYSIEAALNSGLFSKVIVSTDDEEIAAVAKEYGAEVPFLRPKNLSDDFTNTGEVITHALNFFKTRGDSFDYCCSIYPTAPFLMPKYLVEGFKALKNSTAHRSFSVTTMPFPIQRSFKKTKDGRCEMFTPQHFHTRSQDLEESYQDAGQFYWTNLNNSSDDIVFGNDSIPIILPRHLVQDIDTVEDFKYAQMMYEIIQRESE